jgi:hypothetical protein
MKFTGRFAASALLFTTPLFAAIIDVINAPSAYVHPGAAVAVEFDLHSYALANYGESPYPAEIRFSIFGPELASAVTVTGSSAQYVPGFLFQGWLESLDGSYSLPLVDAGAQRLGLPQGMLLVSPGTAVAAGTQMSVSVIDGFVYLDPAVSEAFSGSARIHLINRGEGFTIGLGDVLAVRNSVWTTGLSAGGTLTAGGTTRSIEVMNPEPATWLLMTGAVIFLLTSGFKRKVKIH